MKTYLVLLIASTSFALKMSVLHRQMELTINETMRKAATSLPPYSDSFHEEKRMKHGLSDAKDGASAINSTKVMPYTSLVKRTYTVRNHVMSEVRKDMGPPTRVALLKGVTNEAAGTEKRTGAVSWGNVKRLRQQPAIRASVVFQPEPDSPKARPFEVVEILKTGPCKKKSAIQPAKRLSTITEELSCSGLLNEDNSVGDNDANISMYTHAMAPDDQALPVAVQAHAAPGETWKKPELQRQNGHRDISLSGVTYMK
jgi:hypothetical protein